MTGLLKKFTASACVLALMLTCAVSAFAASNVHHNYVMATSSGTAKGSSVYLSNTNKEYINVSLSCSNSNAIGVVSLYKVGNPDKYYGNDQTLTVSTGNRAWWYGGDSGNYYLTLKVSNNGGSRVTSRGTLQNVA